MADEHKEDVDSPLLDQAALDALFAANVDEGTAAASDEALGGGDYLADEAALGDVDAEGMLIQTPSEPNPLSVSLSETAAAPGSASVADLDLESMFSSVPEQYRTPPEAPEEVAALPPLDPAPAVSADEPEMSQAEIDAILSAATATPPEYVGASAEPEAPVSGPTQDLIDQEELNKLMAVAQDVAPVGIPAEPVVAKPSFTLDQGELDALVSGMSDDAALAGGDMEADVISEGESISLAQDNVESLLSSLNVPEAVSVPGPEAKAVPVTTEPEPASAPTPLPAPTVAAADISQDMINALIAAAAGESPAASEEIGSENLAAAATAAESGPASVPQAQVEHDDLDHLIEESRRKREQQKAAAAYAAVDEGLDRKPRGMPKLESPLFKYLGDNAARVVASLAAGLLVGGSTFFWLYAQQQRTPDLAVLAMQRGSALEEAMEAARKMIDEGEYLRAAGFLQGKIDGAPAGRERTDAAFLRLEALYKSVNDAAPLSRYDEVQSEIDGVLSQAPDHPRVADALHWKALLHERGALPFAALDNYELLIAQHPDTPHMDEILVEASRLALKLGVPDKAARYADRAVQEYPQSPLFAEAKLLQGDAYAHSGQPDVARKLYEESLARETTPLLRAETVLRLGRLAFDEGNYEGAISQIRDYLKKTTTAEGNDAAYLLLAQALRKVKHDSEARDVLNDLLRFFPESKLAPDAYVELSKTLEALGERKSALQIANEGQTRFPTNPKVLQELGELLGLDGNPFSAATTLLAADVAGAGDPAVLLTAARHFRTAGVLEESMKTYNKLLTTYGGSPESFIGGVELAELIYDRGDSKRALDRLEKIATATEGTAQQLPALLAMSRIYDAIGLPARVAEVSEKAAGLTDDPEVLARAASALIKAGSLTEGQKISERVDLSQVAPEAAYGLLCALGKSLLEVDPPRGIEKLEEAYANYPDARKAENDFTLVQAYLNAERAAGARRVVMDMAAREKERPEDAPYLLDAASIWGDYLYGKADYRAAADAYALADETSAAAGAKAVEGKLTDRRWPRYQRANALAKLSDFPGSEALYNDIAQTDAPWAKEAAIKADYMRLQVKMRGGKPAELADANKPGGATAAPAAPQAPGATPGARPAG